MGKEWNVVVWSVFEKVNLEKGFRKRTEEKQIMVLNNNV